MTTRASLGEGVRVDEDVDYGVATGTRLLADLYRPAAPGPHAAVVLIHGGAFHGGSKRALAPWGRFFAEQGYLALAISYTLAAPGKPSYPQNLLDARAAVAYLRSRADELSLDTDRIAAFGCSAGANIAAMLALTRRSEEPAGSASPTGAGVDTVIAVCGLYDLIEQWEHDQLHRPGDQQAEIYLGGTPMDVRPRYYAASPLVHASRSNAAGTRWLISWGTFDDVVSPHAQSMRMAEHLKRAGATVRLAPIVGAAHFWYLEGRALPIDPERSDFRARLADRCRTFLSDWCDW
jgi:acetyl esterase/lipase